MSRNVCVNIKSLHKQLKWPESVSHRHNFTLDATGKKFLVYKHSLVDCRDAPVKCMGTRQE